MKRSKYLKELLLNDQIGIASEIMYEFAEDTYFSQSAFALYSQYKGLKREVIEGVLTEERRELMKNQLRRNGMQILKLLEKKKPNEMAEEVEDVDIEKLEHDVVAPPPKPQAPINQTIFNIEKLDDLRANTGSGTQTNIGKIEGEIVQVDGKRNTATKIQKGGIDTTDSENFAPLSFLFQIPQNRLSQWQPKNPDSPAIEREELEEMLAKVKGEFEKKGEANPNKLGRLLEQLQEFAPEVFIATIVIMDHPKMELSPEVKQLSKSLSS